MALQPDAITVEQILARWQGASPAVYGTPRDKAFGQLLEDVRTLAARLQQLQQENERLKAEIELTRGAYKKFKGYNDWKLLHARADAAETALRELRQAQPEVCLCAAIRLDDGYIVRGHRHDDCIHTITKLRKAGREVGSVTQAEQGFLTSRGRFVDRAEGAQLQRAAGKLGADVTPLLSEDLY